MQREDILCEIDQEEMTNEVRSRKSEVLVNVQHTGDSVTYSTCSPPAPVATKYHTVTG